MNEDTVSNLILQELKLIREEMKEEIRRIGKSIRFFHFDKTNENVFDSNQDFSRNQETSLNLVNNLTNQNNDVIVQAELIPYLTESIVKCERNFYAEQCESSDNFKSDNLKVEFQLEETELAVENENNVNVKEIIEQENLFCETPEPVIVNVKSLCKSKGDSGRLNFDVNSSIFERSEEAGKLSVNKNSTITDFTFKDNNSEIMLEPIDFLSLDEIDVAHKIPSKNKVNFRCEICFLSFSNSADYHHHMKIYADNETHFSDESVQLNHSESIRSNIKRKVLSDVNHLNKRNKNICKFCHETFSSNSNLKVHMRIHTGKNLHQCKVCNKRFSARSYLIKHIRIHTGEKPHKCKICHKRFSQKSNLSTHYRIHTGEKPFKCSLCNIEFRHNCSLTNHIRNHSGEKPP